MNVVFYFLPCASGRAAALPAASTQTHLHRECMMTTLWPGMIYACATHFSVMEFTHVLARTSPIANPDVTGRGGGDSCSQRGHRT